MSRLASILTVVLLFAPAASVARDDAETLRNAKTLFFDRQYEEAREAWREVLAGGGSGSGAALYWIARCSEKLGESGRALEEYAVFLESRPSDHALSEEARTSRVALAARLYKEGRKRHVGILHEALEDSSRTVRYFAALQMASLGEDVGRPAVPVLQEILRNETDPDLVERAKLALLRLDRDALAEASSAHDAPRSGTGKGGSGWIRVRIWEKGASRPQLALNVPVFLADLVFKNLPEDARDELREEGFDAHNFWERLKDSGPTDILTIEGEDGTRIQVWIE